jgi:hypothetical protein
VAPASSSSTDAELAHTIAPPTPSARRAIETRHHLDEELSNLHRELGEDRPCNPQPDLLPVPVREQCREGDGERQESRPTANSPEPVLRHRRLEYMHATTTNAPMRAQTSTVTPCHSSGAHRRTWR